MQGEQGRHEGAGPERSRRPVQEEEQQQRVDQVKKQIGQVVAPGLHPVKLTVQHVGQPGQGVPVGRVEGGETPFHSLPREPRPDQGVFVDIHVVIAGDELIVPYLPVGQRGQGHQQHADDYRLIAGQAAQSQHRK